MTLKKSEKGRGLGSNQTREAVPRSHLMVRENKIRKKPILIKQEIKSGRGKKFILSDLLDSVNLASLTIK